ncbi:hypothetical protein pb186bvf_000762 [Paramecium bursaria]
MQLGNNTDLMLFFQQAQLQLNVHEIEYKNLKPIISCLYGQLRVREKYLEKFSSLNLIQILIANPKILKLLENEILSCIQAMAFLSNVSISQKSLLIQARMYGESAAIQLKNVFEQVKVIKWQFNFLDGFLELIIMHPCYGQMALSFLQIVKMEFSNIILASIVINIVEKIVIDQQQEIQFQLDCFRQIMESNLDQKQQFSVIKIISKILLNINIIEQDNQKISQTYNIIKDKFLNDIKYFQIANNQQIAFLIQNIISQDINITLNNQSLVKKKNNDQLRSFYLQNKK